MQLPMPQFSLRVATLALGILLVDVAQAAPCAGFTDVDDTSAFCKNVEWLKNRAITLGCDASQYCPAEVVTRVSMAAFLNRLGDALTPVHRGAMTSGQGFLDIDTNPIICPTADYTVAGGVRTAHGQASIVVNQGASAVDVAARYVESTNGGMTWNPVSPNQAVTSSGDWQTLNVMLPPRDLADGTTYRHALRLSRMAGSATTGDLSLYVCSVRVTLENRNSATSPFDADD